MVRITLVSGLKGAGKSSLVCSLLQASAGLRICAVVDNVEALELFNAVPNKAVYKGTTKRFDLPNGCTCVASGPDVAAAVAGVVADPNPYDYIVADGAGVGDVLECIEAINEFKLPDGRMLGSVAAVDTVVAVVDVEAFPRILSSHETLDDAAGMDDVNVSELLVEQVELASVIVLNKTDLALPAFLDDLSAFLSLLNPAAQQLRSIYGAVQLSAVLGTRAVKSIEALTYQAGWVQAIKGRLPPRASPFGYSSFVFRARRPFHPRRLHDFLEQARRGQNCLKTVLRSKGQVWLAPRSEKYGTWLHAGREFRLDHGGMWFCCVPRTLWPASKAAQAEIEADFCDDDSIGDRRQELVFFGRKMDQLGLEEALQGCLLSDEEYEGGLKKWTDLEDPFPEWEVEGFDESMEAEAPLDQDTIDRMLDLTV